MPQAAFRRLVVEAFEELKALESADREEDAGEALAALRLEAKAYPVLQSAVEAALVETFQDCAKLARHARRSTTVPDDLKLAIALRVQHGDRMVRGHGVINPIRGDADQHRQQQRLLVEALWGQDP